MFEKWVRAGVAEGPTRVQIADFKLPMVGRDIKFGI
jgi:hypothetical protein